MWDWYSVYIKRSKIDRIELPISFAGAGTGNYKDVKKISDVMAKPVKPKNTAMDMFYRHSKFKPKRKG